MKHIYVVMVMWPVVIYTTHCMNKKVAMVGLCAPNLIDTYKKNTTNLQGGNDLIGQ